MDFALSEEQQMLRSIAERFVAEKYDEPRRRRYRASSRGYSHENWSLLAELGFLGLPFARSDGGLAGSPADSITVMEAMGRGLVVEPILDEILIGGALLSVAGTAEQKHRLITPIIAGSTHVVLAHAEHGTRFDMRPSDTRLRTGRLYGSKTFVPGGADAYIVTAIEGDSPRLCLVAATTPGLVRRDYRRIDGSVASELYFNGASAEPMSGGIESLEAIADTARVAASAEMLGIMSSLFETTLDYVRQRKQFGKPLGSFQALQHRLADLYVSLEQARSLLYRSALTVSSERGGAIAAAKSYISTAAVHLGEECIQFHGGMGVSDELSIGHGHKRILLLASLFGDADHELARYNTMQRRYRASANSPRRSTG
jgi:alkylation response protein AidB-like acyl-CoA dehydrogenase